MAAKKSNSSSITPFAIVLPDDVATVFTQSYPAKVIITPWHEQIDIRNLSLEKAEEIFEKGCDALQRI